MSQLRKGLLVVLSGPSGVGKGTICRELLKKQLDLAYSVSATTRKPRQGEVHGQHYYFYSLQDFQRMAEHDSFLEYAKVYDNYYGTPLEPIERTLEQGQDLILEIDIQGALQIKRKKPDAVFIFIQPPTLEELVRRIKGRGTESGTEIQKRMAYVQEELDHMWDYDYLVVNDQIEKAVQCISAIITAERCSVRRILAEE